MVAVSLALPTDQRGIGNVIGGVFGDVFAQYQKQLTVFKEVAIMLKNGDAPAKIIKETIHKHPEVLKNFTLFTAACNLPTLQNIDYVGQVCKWIDANANKLVDIIDGYKAQTGAVIDKLDQTIQANANKPKTY